MDNVGRKMVEKKSFALGGKDVEILDTAGEYDK